MQLVNLATELYQDEQSKFFSILSVEINKILC